MMFLIQLNLGGLDVPMKRAHDAGARKLRQVPSGDTDGKLPSYVFYASAQRPSISLRYYSVTRNILDVPPVPLLAPSAIRKTDTDRL